MTKIKLLASAAVLASMIVTPVFAQGLREQSQNTSQLKTKQMKNPNVRQSERRLSSNRNVDLRYDRGNDDRGYRRDSGFLPLDVATGIVDGALGTAGAIAAVPFGGDGWDGDYDRVGSTDRYDRAGYRGSYASVNNYGQVGAFATAPYTNPYESNRVTPDNGFDSRTYSQRNEFVCVPGTVFTNTNGIRTLCQ